MKEVILKCFNDFKCIADKCSDNCCIGWEIDIDDDTLAYYDTLCGDLKARLNSSVSYEDTPHFILDKNERCPFLNNDNLCDIIITLGEDKIPYICRNHPRFYTWLPDRTETGMGLCCEVAANLLLSKQETLDTQIPYTLTDSLSDVMTYARDTAFHILQNRSIPFDLRLGHFLDYCCMLDEHMMFEDCTALIKTADSFKMSMPQSIDKGHSISEIADLFKNLEPINEEWTLISSKISDNEEKILKILPEFRKVSRDNSYKYEHLAVYFTYRHFLKSLESYDILSIGRFIVMSTAYCGVLDALSFLDTGSICTEKTARLYSKQVEYSDENTEKICVSDIKNIKELLPLIFGR